MSIKKLVNKMLREDSPAETVARELGMSAADANTMMTNMSFSNYLELQAAITAGDSEKIKSLVGVTEANAYTLARNGVTQNHQGGTQAPVNNAAKTSGSDLDVSDDFKIGDTVNTEKGEGKISSVNKMGGKTTYTTNKNTQFSTSDHVEVPDVTSKEDAESEISRLKDLAGIEEGENATRLKPGGFRGGAIAASALSGATMSLGKIEKLTKGKTKPGPKPKKKRNYE